MLRLLRLLTRSFAMPQCQSIRRSLYCSQAMPWSALSAAGWSTLLAVYMRENLMQITIRCSYKGNVLSCMLFSNADCSLSGAGCATLLAGRSCGDRLRARSLISTARCWKLPRNRFSKLARLLKDLIVLSICFLQQALPHTSAGAHQRHVSLW